MSGRFSDAWGSVLVWPDALARASTARRCRTTGRSRSSEHDLEPAIAVGFHHNVGYFEQRVADCVPDHPCTAEQVDDWNSRGHRASLAAIASYSIAGAALIGGGALYLLDRREPGERSIALAPTPGGAMVTAGGAF